MSGDTGALDLGAMIMGLVFIWFTPWIGRLAVKLIPPQPAAEVTAYQAKHLNPYYLESPTAALDQARLELEHLGGLGLKMLEKALPAALTGSRESLDELRQLDNEVDALHGQILTYLAGISLQDLVAPQPKAILQYISVANYIENLGDVVETGLARDGLLRIEQNVTVSADTVELIKRLHTEALAAVQTALALVVSPDAARANDLRRSKEPFNERVEEARAHLARRLSSNEPRRVETFRLETNMIDSIKRAHTLARRIAWAVAQLVNDEAGP